MVKHLVDYQGHLRARLHDLDGQPLPYEDAVKIVKALNFAYPEYNYVYVLHSTDTGLYKIGFTSYDAEKRCTEVRGEARDNTIYVINSFKYTPYYAKQTEKLLHSIMAPYRKHGEWFDLPQEYVEVFKTGGEDVVWEPYNSRLLYDLMFVWLDYEIKTDHLNKDILKAWLDGAHPLVPTMRNRLPMLGYEIDEELEAWATEAERLVKAVHRQVY